MICTLCVRTEGPREVPSVAGSWQSLPLGPRLSPSPPLRFLLKSLAQRRAWHFVGNVLVCAVCRELTGPACLLKREGFVDLMTLDAGGHLWPQFRFGQRSPRKEAPRSPVLWYAPQGGLGRYKWRSCDIRSQGCAVLFLPKPRLSSSRLPGRGPLP